MKEIMHRLIFRCPTRAVVIHSQVEASDAPLAGRAMRVHCPHCNEWHELSVADAANPAPGSAAA
jgi:hypothetical protein